MVTRFVAELDGHPGQLVILGAGYDTRCHRMELPTNVGRNEVDAAATQAWKRALLEEIEGAHPDARFVACAFTRESWREKLEAAGFDPAVRTCLVWPSPRRCGR